MIFEYICHQFIYVVICAKKCFDITQYNMLAWILQVMIMSLIFIVLTHNIIMYFKDTLTVHKVKDILSSNNKKYKEIIDIMNNNNNNDNNKLINDKYAQNTTAIEDLLPESVSSFDDINGYSMKDELKNFLKSQMS